MTRDEATKTIDYLKEDYKKLLTEEDIEALDMAIEALKQVTGKLNNPDDSLLTEDPEACKEQKSKLDLISRAEAIEAIELVDWYHQNNNKDMVHGANDDEHQAWYKADDVYKALEAVPSADRPRGGVDTMRGIIRKLIYKMRKRRFCKLNRWFCPDCIYHDFVFDEREIFRGNRCRYPKPIRRVTQND